MKVPIELEDDYVSGDYGDVYGLRIVCTRCGHSVQVPGRHDGSAKRGAALLSEECPEGEDNFYVLPD